MEFNQALFLCRLAIYFSIEQPKATLYNSSHRKSTEGSTIGSLEFITSDQERTTQVFMYVILIAELC